MSNGPNQHRNRTFTETSLIEDIARCVRRFMARSNQLSNYDGTIEWRIYSDHTVAIEVSIHRADP